MAVSPFHSARRISKADARFAKRGARERREGEAYGKSLWQERLYLDMSFSFVRLGAFATLSRPSPPTADGLCQAHHTAVG
jgi:hypothetical protein